MHSPTEGLPEEEASTAPEPYRVLWAKSDPEHPLWKHLLDVAAVSLALPNPLVDDGWNANHVGLIVGSHDIGKADSAFQHQVPAFAERLNAAGFCPTQDARCRHERLSAEFLKKRFTESGTPPHTAAAIVRAILAHHGYWDEGARPSAPAYAAAQGKLYDLLQTLLDVNGFPVSPPANLSAFGMRLAGHLVLCDWIASNEGFFTDERLKEQDDPAVYFTKAREVALERVVKLGMDRPQNLGKPASIVANPRPLQKVLLENDIPPGLVIIEAPMGEGKTEAAWILAEKWRDSGYHGMYMALPTMATSDSLFKRYQDHYLKPLGHGEGAKLVHGMAWLRDNEEPEKPPNVGEPGDDRALAAAWFRPTRRAMLAAHGVGTVDQAMLAGMHVKFGFLRLFGLTSRVLVIDEVHAYDAYMSAIIARLLQWCACLKIPVLMLSATLSARQRATMLEAYGATGGDPGPDAPYPLITIATPGSEATTITAEASASRTLRLTTWKGLLGDAKATVALAQDLVKDGGCCCVILNTVKQAQAVYKALKLPAEEKLLFHARFTAEDREKIARKVLEKFGKDTSVRPPGKFILVATQVVEQSLDVDFDHMISEIAPIDLLLQRSGRLHRHRKREEDPVLHVLLPGDDSLEFGGSGFVYAEKPLLRTLAILSAYPEARLPCDFRVLIERCYGTEEWEQHAVDWQRIRESDNTWDEDMKLFHQKGATFTLRTPSKRYFKPVENDPAGDDSDDGNGWRAKTRLGANDRTALLVEQDQVDYLESGELRMKDVRALYKESLKLPAYLPIHAPDEGHGAAVEGKGKLRGLLLLPVDRFGIWNGHDKKGRRFEVTYDQELGLLAGRKE